MMISRLLSAAFIGLALLLHSSATAQSFDPQRELEKARKETFPRSAKAIEEATDVKLTLEVDAASFGSDEKAWSNLYIVANRVVGALSEVGKDQVGKDAIAANIKRVVITKPAAGVLEDSIELKDGTLTVKSSATDLAVSLLQGIITRSLEKAFNLATPTEKPQ
jgi:hypothetical protein